jgi:hypothetical protein
MDAKRSMVYWACDECFNTYKFDPYTHHIVGLRKE